MARRIVGGDGEYAGAVGRETAVAAGRVACPRPPRIPRACATPTSCCSRRSGGTGQAKVDDLRIVQQGVVERLGQREAVAVRAAVPFASRRARPSGALSGAMPAIADAVIGARGNDAGDRPCRVLRPRRFVPSTKFSLHRHLSCQVRVGGFDTAVDHGHQHLAAGGGLAHLLQLPGHRCRLHPVQRVAGRARCPGASLCGEVLDRPAPRRRGCRGTVRPAPQPDPVRRPGACGKQSTFSAGIAQSSIICKPCSRASGGSDALARLPAGRHRDSLRRCSRPPGNAAQAGAA